MCKTISRAEAARLAAVTLLVLMALLLAGCKRQASGAGRPVLVPITEDEGASLEDYTTGNIPLPPPQLALVYEGMIVVGDTVDPGWEMGTPELVAGTYVEQDPSCIDNPGDYESDQMRYWECYNSEPENAYDYFAAYQPIIEKDLPAELSMWRGQKLALYGSAGKLCEATVGEMRAWAEWSANMAALDANSSENEDVARAVLNNNAIAMAKLEGACEGAVFARAADLPPLPQWAVKAAEGRLATLLQSEIAKLPAFGVIVDAGITRAAPTLVELVPPAGGRRYAAASLAGATGCHENGVAFAIWEVTGTGTSPKLEPVPMLTDVIKDFEITAAADVTGDGIPEIVTNDGVLIWLENEAAHFSIVDFPEVPRDPCHCECE